MSEKIILEVYPDMVNVKTTFTTRKFSLIIPVEYDYFDYEVRREFFLCWRNTKCLPPRYTEINRILQNPVISRLIRLGELCLEKNMRENKTYVTLTAELPKGKEAGLLKEIENALSASKMIWDPLTPLLLAGGLFISY